MKLVTVFVCVVNRVRVVFTRTRKLTDPPGSVSTDPLLSGDAIARHSQDAAPSFPDARLFLFNAIFFFLNTCHTISLANAYGTCASALPAI